MKISRIAPLLVALASSLFGAVSITTQPRATTVVSGQPASFEVAATGDAALGYQWRRNGFAISGATNAAFTIAAATRSDADYYDVLVNDGGTPLASATVRLSVAPADYPRYLFNDATQNLVLTRSSGNATATAVDANDNIYVGGEFVSIDGQTRTNVAKFSSAGVLDPAFAPNRFYGRVNVILPLPNGKVLVGGEFYFRGVSARTSCGLVRLNADGTVDDTGVNPNIGSSVYALALDASGRFLVGGNFNGRLCRLNPDGSPDTSFALTTSGSIYDVSVQADGKILIGGDFTTINGVQRNRVARLNPDGTLDGTFDQGAGATGADQMVRRIRELADGKVLVFGEFSNFRGTAAYKIARLSSTGEVDTSFTGSGSFWGASDMLVLPDARILLAGLTGSTPQGVVTRLSADGTVDPTFSVGATGGINRIARLSDNRVVVVGGFTTFQSTARLSMAVINADGTLNSALNVTPVFPAQVSSMLNVAGGKMLIAGNFTAVNGVAANRLARLNADGSVDTSYGIGTGANGDIRHLVLAPDGKVVAVGSFRAFNGINRLGAVRLNADGSVDTTFVPSGTEPVFPSEGAPVLTSTGRLLIPASNSTWSGNPVYGLLALNSDGTRDTGFNIGTGIGQGGYNIRSLAMQPDGKFLVGGAFSSFNGQPFSRLVRLNADGSVDTSFSTGTGPSSDVQSIVVLDDGKILISGNFSYFNGTNRNGVARLNANGSLDTTFVPGNNRIMNRLLRQDDGRLILWTDALLTTDPQRILRLLADGTVDISFGITAQPYELTSIALSDSGQLYGASWVTMNPFGLARYVSGIGMSIITPPQDNVVNRGDTATFGIQVSGTGPFQYQWGRNGMLISGATNSTLTLNNVQVSDVATYAVSVWSNFGPMVSASARIVPAGVPPQITSQPAAYVNGTAGSPTTLSVAAVGTDLSYQWTRNGSPIAGATNATLTLSGGVADSGLYNVTVASGLAVQSSSGIRVKVGPSASVNGTKLSTTFAPKVEATGVVNATAVLPDNRYYIAGAFTTVDGVKRTGIARLMPDGQLDPTFAPPAISNSTVMAVAVDATGRVLIGGDFGFVVGAYRPNLARLNADGTVDMTFTPGLSPGSIQTIVVEQDGRILVGGVFTTYNGRVRGRIARLTSNGELDSSLDDGVGFDGPVNSLALQSDGKIIVGGNFVSYDGRPCGRVARLNSDGTLDEAFAEAMGSGFNSRVNSVGVDSQGRVIVGGEFTRCGTNQARYLARLSSAGVFDAAFARTTGNAGLDNRVKTLAVHADDSVTAGGVFAKFDTTSVKRIARFTAAGALDTRVVLEFADEAVVNTVMVRPDGVTVAGGEFETCNGNDRYSLLHLRADASLAPDTEIIRGWGSVISIVPVSGGKWMVGGYFTMVNGHRAPCIVRLNGNGSVDESFVIGSGFNSDVSTILELGDGSLLVGGSFTSYNGTAVPRLAHLSANGTLDTGFNMRLVGGFGGDITSLAVQTDGKILAGGIFSSFNNASTPGLVRLLPNGNRDTGFNASSSVGTQVVSVIVQPDGKIVVGSASGGSSGALMRLNQNGTLDRTAEVPEIGSGTVVVVEAQPDGKILIGGRSLVNGSTSGFLARYNPDLTRDPTFSTGAGFQAGMGGVYGLTVQPDGKIITIGFGYYDGHRNGAVARLTSTGVLDTTFNTASPGGYSVFQPVPLALMEDGTLLAGIFRYHHRDGALGGLLAFENGPTSTIMHQYWPQQIAAGQTATFGVFSAGVGKLRYQWMKDGVALDDSPGRVAGSSAQVLTIYNAQSQNAGDYSVTVTDDAGPLTSEPMALVVSGSAPVTMARRPFATPGIAQAGTGFVSIVAPSFGSDPIAATWRKDGTDHALVPYDPVSRSYAYSLLNPQASDTGIYDLRLANDVSVATTDPVVFVVDQESNWMWRNPLPSSNELTGLFTINGVFHLSAAQGARFTSVDGATFKPLPSIGSGSIYAYGNGLHVVLSKEQVAVVSIDGVNWKKGFVGTAARRDVINDLAFGNGVFVAVCESGKAFTSTDGISWTERNVDLNASIRRVCAWGGVFVAGSATGRLYSSNDGVTWETNEAISGGITLLAEQNGILFVSTTRGGLHTSEDGTTWAKRVDTPVGLTAVSYANGTYVAVGGNGIILTSNDAVSWSTRPSGVTSSLKAVAYAAQTWVVAGSGPNALLASWDGGLTWEGIVTSITAANLVAGASNGTNLVAVGYGGTILSSSDGRSWTTRASGTTNNFSDVAFGGGVYVAVGAGGVIRRSADGSTWATVASGTTAQFLCVAYLDSQFVATTNAGGIFTSPDGNTWTSRSTGVLEGLRGVAFGNDTYVAVGTAGTLITSPDCVTWAHQQSRTSVNLNEIVYQGGRFLAVGDNSTTLTSPDGMIWQTYASPIGKSMVHVSVLTPPLESSVFLVSTLGGGLYGQGANSWFGRFTGVSGTLNETVVFNGNIYGFGDAGLIVSAPLAPQVAIQPEPAGSALGGSATFSVLGAGTAYPVSYQWRKDGVAIAGATNPSLTVSGITAEMAGGSYDVVLTNPFGSVTSTPVLLNEPLSIVDQPISCSGVAGGAAVFTVGARGAPTLTYQWKKDGSDIAGATLSKLVIDGLSDSDAGAYTVVVTGPTGTATSTPATLTVLTPEPMLWLQYTSEFLNMSPGRTIHDGAGGVFLPWSTSYYKIDVQGGKVVGAMTRVSETDGARDTSFALGSSIADVGYAAKSTQGLLLGCRYNGRHTVVRVDAAGVVDSTFSAPVFGRSIRFITVQPDGKLLVAATGSIADREAPSEALGLSACGVWRLESNGALDSTFTPALHGEGTVFAPPLLDSENRVYLGGNFSQINGVPRKGIARLSATGVVDTAFADPAALPAGFVTTSARGIGLQSSGKVVLVGAFRMTGRGSSSDPVGAIRFNADGTYDTSFAQPRCSELGVVSATTVVYLRAMIMTTDDKFVAVSNRLLRFNADGTLDSTFKAQTFENETYWVSMDAQGRLYVPAVAAVKGQVAMQPVTGYIARFGADGTFDPTFQTLPWGNIGYASSAAVLPDGTLWLAGGFNRLGSRPVPGLVQLTPSGMVSFAQVHSPLVGPTSVISAAADGTIIAEMHSTVNDQIPSSLVRVRPDGAIDRTFVPMLPSTLDSSELNQVCAANGRILLVANVSPTRVPVGLSHGMFRLDANGGTDSTFNASALLGTVYRIERDGSNAITSVRAGSLEIAQTLSDGKSLVLVSDANGSVSVRRLLQSGAVDTAFSAPVLGTVAPTVGSGYMIDPQTGANGSRTTHAFSIGNVLRAAHQMANGTVFVGGALAPSGAPRGLVRLTSTGAIDTAFTGAGIAHSRMTPYVSALASDSAGRLYVAGLFDSYNGTPVPGLFRLKADGSLDTAWAPGFGVLDQYLAEPSFYPRIRAGLIVRGEKLYAFGAVGSAGDAVPAPYKMARLTDLIPVSVSPGTAAAGSTIMITGSDFTGATAVSFGTVPAASFNVVSDTQISAVVPRGAVTGLVSITTPIGIMQTSTALTIPVGPRLGNMSIRANVGTGENALMGTITVEGGNRTVLVRAAGPALLKFGVQSVLADPVLTLHDASGAVVATNNDWGGTTELAQAFGSAGAFPFTSDSKDAAILARLAPGTYTARVVGAGGSTGIALLEAYETGALEADTARVVLMASRVAAGFGADTMITGLVVTGSTSAGKMLLVRAIGTPLVPALGAITNPRIEIRSNLNQLLFSNDDWGTNTNAADIAAASSEVGAMPLGTNDAALLVNLSPGLYTVLVSPASGSAGFSATEVFVVDGYRAATAAPALVAPMLDRGFRLEVPLYLNAPAIGKGGAMTFEWKREGTTITGEPVAGAPGAIKIPSPTVGDRGVYTVMVTNSAGSITSTPFVLKRAHSADTSTDMRISLVELTRVIELYNTRVGTVRTGCYNVATNTEDMYTPDATRAETVPVTLTRYHTADSNRDGRIDLTELTRVIELYNYRVGTARTGEYHEQTGTEDGFAPGP